MKGSHHKGLQNQSVWQRLFKSTYSRTFQNDISDIQANKRSNKNRQKNAEYYLIYL